MRIWAVLLIVALAGCTNNAEVPPGIIRRPKMEKIMWDMLQADRFAATFIQSRADTLDRNRKETIELYDKVFSYNGITRADFLKSYQFYLGRPDILKDMFDSLSVQAERKRADIYRRPRCDSTSKKPDSIRRRIFPKSLPPRLQ